MLSNEIKTTIDLFIYAIEEEIKAQKRENEMNAIKIYDGKYVSRGGIGYIYTFSFDNEFYNIEEIKAKMMINGQNFPAEILSVYGSQIEISILEFIGEKVSEALIDFRLWYLLEILKNRYKNYDEILMENDFKLSNMIFKGWCDSKDNNVKIAKGDLNEAQINAVKKSLTKNLNIIWGPPGTGKTRTLAKLIKEHLKLKRRVLLLSFSNNAVDEAMKYAMKDLKQLNLYEDGKILRYGYPQSKFVDYYEKNYENILIDNILGSKYSSLMNEKELLNKKKSSLVTTIEDLRRKISEYYDKIDDLSDERNRLELSLNVLNMHLNEHHEISNPNEDIEKLEETIKKKKEDLVMVEEQLNDAKLKEKEILALKEELKGLENNLCKVDEDINKIENEISEKRNKILSRARFIATTVAKTFCDDILANEKFDVLIVDEISMISLPYLYWVISRCRMNAFVTLAGDFLQLPPICMTDDEIAKNIMGKNIFNHLDIDKVDNSINSSLVCLLDTQYRMVQDISSIPNKFYYKGYLKDDNSVLNRCDQNKSDSIIMIDTSDINPNCYHIASGSRFNIYNAFVSIKIAESILNKNNEWQVGIITPYSAQARLINKMMRESNMSKKIIASTVHSFQGGECDAIIFDASDSTGLVLSPLLNDEYTDSDADLLLNVALTRAKMCFYFIGNIPYLLSGLSNNSLIKRVILYISQNSTTVKSREVLKECKAENFTIYNGNDLSNVDKRDFKQDILHDIDNANERVIIVCPKISKKGICKFYEPFSKMTENGVNITIYTNPTFKYKNRNAKDVIEEIRNKNIKVIEREKLNINMYIIDSIIWAGNINIFYGVPNKINMIRYKNQLAVEEIIKYLELNKSNGIGDVVDKRCPKCGNPMIIRKGKYSIFLGCSNYPICKCAVGLK
ncbi:AAA domain-containing protein [Thermoanaerobacterium thermosaccharolyticum]|uniref:AAA domain-containing protein n=1 Tax=Thermoanaerobacterium thermosaccharolyticum TaxID=1517 RepID=UPI003D2967BD